MSPPAYPHSMSFKTRIVILILAIVFGLIFKTINKHFGSVEKPDLILNQYWGEGEVPANYDTPSKLQLVRPYYSDEIIADLSTRLAANITLHKPLEGINFEYGFNSDFLKELITYWKDDYLPRWREREISIWQFPHYTTTLHGLRLHYLHLKIYDDVKEQKQMYPILLLHGWPSSVREFYDLAPKLYKGNEDSKIVFDIVIPSLPGFGWSQGASKKGMGPAQIAVILRNLMLRIGYSKFFIHGSDWGSVIGSHIATLFPENVLGYHSNMCVLYTPLSGLKLMLANWMPSLFVKSEHKGYFFPLSKSIQTIFEETGYFHLQATKPETIGTVLTDNPIGLAAYILEKFSSWSNETFKTLPDGGLTTYYNLDVLLDNVMIYYLTNSITTSQRLFAEAVSKEHTALKLDRVPTYVPTGCARFKGEIAHRHYLDFQLKEKYKSLIHSSYHDKGGHFVALEQSDILYKDIIEFVIKAREFLK